MCGGDCLLLVLKKMKLWGRDSRDNNFQGSLGRVNRDGGSGGDRFFGCEKIVTSGDKPGRSRSPRNFKKADLGQQ